MNDNTTLSRSLINSKARETRLGHRPILLWFTGYSGAGKATLCALLEKELFERGLHSYFLDAITVRQGMNKDVGFDESGRHENMRRVGYLCRHLLDAGQIVLAGFISPFRHDRALIENIIRPYQFVEIYLSTSIEECERRDPKGLYRRARNGEIKNFTGLSAPYEKPENPAIEIKTDALSPEDSLQELKTKLYKLYPELK